MLLVGLVGGERLVVLLRVLQLHVIQAERLTHLDETGAVSSAGTRSDHQTAEAKMKIETRVDERDDKAIGLDIHFHTSSQQVFHPNFSNMNPRIINLPSF